VGLRIVLNAVVKRKIPSLRRESNPRIPIVQPVAQRYIDRAITSFSSVLGEITSANKVLVGNNQGEENCYKRRVHRSIA
jgi:hypothetical protein